MREARVRKNVTAPAMAPYSLNKNTFVKVRIVRVVNDSNDVVIATMGCTSSRSEREAVAVLKIAEKGLRSPGLSGADPERLIVELVCAKNLPNLDTPPATAMAAHCVQEPPRTSHSHQNMFLDQNL